MANFVPSVMKSAPTNRIQFLDMARLVAVFMMIQGHTIKTLLGDQWQDPSHAVYGTWRYVRGFTAPMFMLIAGMVFTYLLFRGQPLTGPHPRYRKGIIRAVLLLALGYWINCSGFYCEIWENHTLAFRRALWRVDVLQCIGASLLVLLGLHRLFRPSVKQFALGALVLVAGALAGRLLINDLPLSEYLPLALSQYFTAGEGSLFPLVPWVSYLLIGALIGGWISTKPASVFNTPKFALQLGAIGGGLVLMGMLGDKLEMAVWGESRFWSGSPCLVFFRTGWVVVACALLVLVGRLLGPMPQFARQISRNALWLYIGHLRLIGWIHGAGWNELSPWMAIATAMFVLLCMAALTKVLVWLGNKTGIRL